MRSNEEWDYELRERIFDRATTDSDILLKALIHVFKRLPENDADILLNDRCAHFVLPTVNMAFCFPRIARVFEGEDVVEIETWLILLQSDSIKLPEEEFIYVIVHELAHCFLEHPILGAGECELEADKQVIKWGFEKELRATPWNYLYGNRDPDHGLKFLKEIYEKERR